MAEDGGADPKEYEADEKKGVESEKSMAPWEQHSAVISLPRFDYNAPSSILQHSHCGFLVTCTIKREKSATKEVLSILEKYVDPLKNKGNDGWESQENKTVKRRRVCTEDNGSESLDLEETSPAIVNSDEGILSEGTHVCPKNAETASSGAFDLSLVKLTRSGLLLFTFPRNELADTVDIVSNIIQSFEAGKSSPLWCHRIFPIQATCHLNEKDLQEVVSTLVKKFVVNRQNRLGQPLKFAVGYNRRGIEETLPKEKADSSSEYSLLDRNKCFGVVASAVRQVVEDSTVDLKCPEISILVEWLPLSGLPTGSIIVAVSVLPINLVSTKPRLSIKALTSNTKQKA